MTSKLINHRFSRFNSEQLLLLQQAYQYANAAHGDQKRKSGEKYITHPLAVATILSEWQLDVSSVAAGLLHDVLEDTNSTKTQLEGLFGSEITFLVNGVTKLGEVELGDSGANASVENIRKLLLAMSKDLRVTLIKLADRLHNLRTLQYLELTKRIRIANESLEIYAPIADRLGMGRLKAEIEDLSFCYADEKEYYALKKRLTPIIHSYTSKLDEVIDNISRRLQNDKIKFKIESRTKHLYSTSKKLKKYHNQLEEIRDLVAVRIIVDDIEKCYQVLGTVHQLYKPMVSYIKDYIAVPKPNGYQSLHTTVLGENGMIFEVQIRTELMHQEAERGLAAHYYYNQNKTDKSYLKNQSKTLPNKLNWVNNLLDWQENLNNSADLKDALKIDLFNNRIFVFSPKGDLFDLPEESTPVDFAFALHSDVGLRLKGAKVNGQIANLNKKLKNRDVVELLLAKNVIGPSRDWLNIVKTAKAKTKIKQWLRNIDRSSNLSIGRNMIEKQMDLRGLDRNILSKSKIIQSLISKVGMNNIDSVFVAVGEGSLTAEKIADTIVALQAPKEPIIRKIFQKKVHYQPQLIGQTGIEMTIAAQCCNPVYPQPITAVITKNSGVIVHHMNCASIVGQSSRLMEVDWVDVMKKNNLKFEIIAISRVGLLSEITTAIAANNLMISTISRQKRKHSQSSILVEVENINCSTEASLVRQLTHVTGVRSVKKRK